MRPVDRRLDLIGPSSPPGFHVRSHPERRGYWYCLIGQGGPIYLLLWLYSCSQVLSRYKSVGYGRKLNGSLGVASSLTLCY